MTEKVSQLTKVSAAGRRMLRESGLDMDSQRHAGMPLVVVVHFAQDRTDRNSGRGVIILLSVQREIFEIANQHKLATHRAKPGETVQNMDP